MSAPPTAPSTPRSAMKDLSAKDSNFTNNLVYSITFANIDHQNRSQTPEDGFEEEIEEEEEDFDNFQYFKERRFSIFPIP